MITRELLAKRERLLAVVEVITAARCMLQAASHWLNAVSLRVADRWDGTSGDVKVNDEHGVNAPGGVA